MLGLAAMHAFGLACALLFAVRVGYTWSLSRHRGVINSTDTHKVVEAKWSALSIHLFGALGGVLSVWFVVREVRGRQAATTASVLCWLPWWVGKGALGGRVVVTHADVPQLELLQLEALHWVARVHVHRWSRMVQLEVLLNCVWGPLMRMTGSVDDPCPVFGAVRAAGQWKRWPVHDPLLDVATVGLVLSSALLGWTHHALGANWSPVITVVSDLSHQSIVMTGFVPVLCCTMEAGATRTPAVPPRLAGALRTQCTHSTHRHTRHTAHTHPPNGCPPPWLLLSPPPHHPHTLTPTLTHHPPAT
jgi:hypothetical protein